MRVSDAELLEWIDWEDPPNPLLKLNQVCLDLLELRAKVKAVVEADDKSRHLNFIHKDLALAIEALREKPEVKPLSPHAAAKLGPPPEVRADAHQNKIHREMGKEKP